MMLDIILLGSFALISSTVCYFIGRGRRERTPKNEVDKLLDEIEKNMPLTEFIDDRTIKVGKYVVFEAGFRSYDGWNCPELRYQGRRLKPLKWRQERRITKLVHIKI